MANQPRQTCAHRTSHSKPTPSREAASECSPGRKPGSARKNPSLEKAKETPLIRNHCPKSMLLFLKHWLRYFAVLCVPVSLW